MKKLLGFDALRGVAAFLVFIFHFYGMVGLSGIFDAAHVGLDIFFVLSGFLIYRSVYKHGVNWQYFLRRILRIAPIYYFSIFIVVAFMGAGLTWQHLLFVQSFSESTYYAVNPVLWSLSVEMIFYLFLPAFFIFTGRKTWSVIAGVVVMLAITYWFRDYVLNFYDQWDSTQRIIYTENFIGRLDHFAFGILASFLVLKIGENERASMKWLGSIMVFLGIGGIIFGMHRFHILSSSFREIYFYQMFLHAIVAASTAALMFGLVYCARWIKMLIGNPLLESFGVISYSFYVWHFVLTQKIVELELTIFQELVLSFAVVTAFSTVTYWLIEKPFLKLKRYR